MWIAIGLAVVTVVAYSLPPLIRLYFGHKVDKIEKAVIDQEKHQKGCYILLDDGLIIQPEKINDNNIAQLLINRNNVKLYLTIEGAKHLFLSRASFLHGAIFTNGYEKQTLIDMLGNKIMGCEYHILEKEFQTTPTLEEITLAILEEN